MSNNNQISLKESLTEEEIKILVDFAYKYNMLSYYQRTDLRDQARNILKITKEYYAQNKSE